MAKVRLKKVILWGMQCALLLLIGGVYHFSGWSQCEVGRKLEQEAPDIVQLEVAYGSAWPGSVWKYITIRDKASIRRVIDSLQCKDSHWTQPDDGVLGYNTSYNLTLHFVDAHRKAEVLYICPSNDSGGVYFLIPSEPSNKTSNTHTKWAEMNSRSFEDFTAALRSVPGTRSADRH